VTQPTNPLVSFQFAVEVSGVISGYFTEASGLGSENEVIETKMMSKDGRQEIVQKIPGRLKWGDITLKRGITDSMDIWNWRKDVTDGKIASSRKNGSITMYSQDGTEVARWNFENGWPSKVSGPSVNAGSNEVGVEELIIVHEGIKRVT
jgi:phage tail-like protein